MARHDGRVTQTAGRRCVFTAGSDSLDAIALHLARLDIPFTPLEPAELRDRCAVLADRLRQAAHRQPSRQPSHQPSEEPSR